eukprot:TRINITY_DN5319_c0_g1_i1.p1 TRINITY_DN5319_c0_g1~~TRINITY_DN5319_c0_g1_i1.p1  ORF type:complete len:870 (-),score=290.39 TRINITY_DN5319_c0_g1_i1:73-2682(-)
MKKNINEEKPKTKPGEKPVEMSEEDKLIKEGLDLAVERLKDPKEGIRLMAIDHLKKEIKTSTSSMTSVPKPLKFLRPHYQTIKETFDNSNGDRKNLADILSVLAMTMGKEDERESLKYKLHGNREEIGEWGHEYVRNLTGEIGNEFSSRQEQKLDVKELIELVEIIVPFYMKHNGEPDAVDLLLEIEMPRTIEKFCDKENYSRVCLYLISCSHYLSEPEDIDMLRIAYDLYRKFGELTNAMRVAFKIGDNQLMENLFQESSNDKLLQIQLSFILAREQKFIYNDQDDEEQENLYKINGNGFASKYHHVLGDDLKLSEPKTFEDIYRTELLDSRHRPNNDTSRGFLASTFVNGFINAAFGKDKLMTVEEEDKNTKWVYKHKDEGQLCAVASLGLIHLWDNDTGCDALNPFSYTDNNFVKAGMLLGVGIVNNKIRDPYERAMGLLTENIGKENADIIRIASIYGLGIAYAGTGNKDVTDLLLPILEENDSNMSIISFAALSLGLINVASANNDIVDALITNPFFERSETDLGSSVGLLLALGLGLIFLGKGEETDIALETLSGILEEKKAVSPSIITTIEVCAYAGTGNVLKVQKMLSICTDHPEKEQKEQAIATLGVGLISMGEEIGSKMVLRSYDHLLQYGEPMIRKACPLAIGLLSISTPDVSLMDTLSKLSHDHDANVACSAILGLGLLSAGTNNSRAGQLLRSLSEYYYKDQNQLFMVRISQALLHSGKGTLTLSPYHSQKLYLNKVSLAGILITLFSSLDLETNLFQRPYLLYSLVCALETRMLITIDENNNPVPVNVRVGKAVDTVGLAGKPKTITGFQTYSTPVLLGAEDRAEFVTEEYIALSSVLEGVVVVKKNPEYISESK